MNDKIHTTLGLLTEFQFRNVFLPRFAEGLNLPIEWLRRKPSPGFWMADDALRSVKVRPYMTGCDLLGSPCIMRVKLNFSACTSPSVLKKLDARIERGVFGGTLRRPDPEAWRMEFSGLPDEILASASWLGWYSRAMDFFQERTRACPVAIDTPLVPIFGHNSYVWTQAGWEAVEVYNGRRRELEAKRAARRTFRKDGGAA